LIKEPQGSAKYTHSLESYPVLPNAAGRHLPAAFFCTGINIDRNSPLIFGTEFVCNNKKRNLNKDIALDFNIIKSLRKKSDAKILFLVMDGLGGIPRPSDRLSELEAANTPNLNRLASEGECGLHQPIGPGITPGSGPSHLALFGYDPVKYEVGRGVLSALGVGFDLKPDDIAARGNFCTVDDSGTVTDRRAGRISTDKNKELCEELRKIKLSGAELHIQTVSEHRFLIVLRGTGLGDKVNDTDPQETGLKPIEAVGEDDNSEKTASLVKEFLEKAGQILKDHHPANMVLMRGFSKRPDWPTMPEIYGFRAAAIANYPMYRGVARLVGMDVLNADDGIDGEFNALKDNWNKYDFFYLHIKKSDSYGEDGNFESKKSIIEETDEHLGLIEKLKPDVVLVTGDHSTPAEMKFHSWHPVPVLIWSKFVRPDGATKFGERECLKGALGVRFPATDLMPLVMANSHRLEKYGA